MNSTMAHRAISTSAADGIRGTVSAVAVGVWTILTPASGLPHGFGYYAAVAAFLLGLRFGSRGIGMFCVACVAVGIAQLVGRGACTASSNRVTCGFEAAAPILIFGYLVGATIVGALLSGSVRMSRAMRDARRGSHGGPGDRGTLLPGHTLVVALAAATVAFIGCAALPLHGAPLFLSSVAACAAFGLAPTYRVDHATTAETRPGVPTW